MSKPLFVPTPKQQEFIDAVLSGIYKFLFFGGAAGGGKTYVMLAIFIFLSKVFPNSKWCVVRKDYAKLKQNTIPTFFKICPRRFLVKFTDGVAYFTNGSQIIFKGENFNYDKDLTWMDGFECNGFGGEEVQELSRKFFEKAKLRAGRHIIEPMPPIVNLFTGNPSQNWSKDVFVNPAKEGTLESPYFYLPALMSDNPHLPKEYVEGLSTLDSITFARYVMGDWDVIDVDKPFAYAFNLKKHVAKLKAPVKSLPVYLSFDFNVDPITCNVVQSDMRSWIRFHKEYRLRNSNIYELCAAIKRDHQGYYFYVTGDAAGHARNVGMRDNQTYYTVVMQELGIKKEQMLVPSVNPLISNNRVLVNALLERFPELLFDSENCKYTIEDLLYVEVNGYGDIDKTKDKHRSHLLDTVRYFLNTCFKEFVKYKL